MASYDSYGRRIWWWPHINITSYWPNSLRNLADVKIKDIKKWQTIAFDPEHNVFVNSFLFEAKQWLLKQPDWIEVNIETIDDFISLFFPSIPPDVSLTTDPSNYLREYWVTVENPILNVSYELWKNPTKDITDIYYYRDWEEIFHWTWDDTSYQDEYTVEDKTTYSVKIIDELWREDSTSRTYDFVYPFFRWVINEDDIYDWITEDEVDDILHKHIWYKWTKSFTSSPENQKFCFMYPAAYWDLRSIIDQSWFETIDDYNVDEITITDMLDWTDQKYKRRRLKDPTTQTDFTNTYYF